MQTLEKRPEQLVKIFALQDPCILRKQGAELFASAFAEKTAVTLDFQRVKYVSPAFFDGLFEQAVIEDFKKINFTSISPLGRKLLFWAMNAKYDVSSNSPPLYQVFKTKTDILHPILYLSNGIITIMTESGVAEWLEQYGSIHEIEPECYEKLMSEKTKAHIEYRERQLAASKPLECPKCHKAYHGSINGFRKHVHYCKKGQDR